MIITFLFVIMYLSNGLYYRYFLPLVVHTPIAETHTRTSSVCKKFKCQMEMKMVGQCITVILK